MAVEHQRLAASGPAPRADGIGAVVLDLLPLDVQAKPLVELYHQLGHALLVAREARDIDHPAGGLYEPVTIDSDGRRGHAHASLKC